MWHVGSSAKDCSPDVFHYFDRQIKKSMTQLKLRSRNNMTNQEHTTCIDSPMYAGILPNPSVQWRRISSGARRLSRVAYDSPLNRLKRTWVSLQSRHRLYWDIMGALPILILRVIIRAQALDRLIPIIGCNNEQLASNWIYKNLSFVS